MKNVIATIIIIFCIVTIVSLQNSPLGENELANETLQKTKDAEINILWAIGIIGTLTTIIAIIVILKKYTG